MRYDTIIIGGGLAGFTCGIRLAEAGQRVLIAAAGQSSLHYASGSIGLMGYNEGGEVALNPFEVMAQLPASHPYAKVTGHRQKAAEAQELLSRAGMSFAGGGESNHCRLTPIGTMIPAWLTLQGLATANAAGQTAWKRAAIVNIEGFLDFPVDFFRHHLEQAGVATATYTVTTPELEYARRSPSEMRATNIAKVLDDEEKLRKVAAELRKIPTGADVMLLPAVMGFANSGCADTLRGLTGRQLQFVVTMPPSVPGVMMQQKLRRRFCALGGTYLNNDAVTGGELGRQLENITTEHLQDTPLKADNYVLATGSFMSGGLLSNYRQILEPVFGLDVDAHQAREDWHAAGVFDAQPYMTYGVRTDEKLRTQKAGQTIGNLYAAGDVLSGNDATRQADKEGVDMLTALQAAHNILSE